MYAPTEPDAKEMDQSLAVQQKKNSLYSLNVN